MSSNFMSFSTVFLLYQGDRRMQIKGHLQQKPFYKILAIRAGFEPGPLAELLRYWIECTS